MFAFLSPAWLDQLTAAAGGDQVGPGATIMQQVVTGAPGGDIEFVLEVDGGHVRARPGRDERAVVTLTEAWETAVLIHRGRLTTQEAFRGGLVRLHGDVRGLIDASAELRSLEPAMTALRERTSDV